MNPLNPRKTTITILAMLSASLALAEDFKTINGKEYKNATVTQVEADGIAVRTKRGISKLYFAELPEDVRTRFHYDPQKAAAAQAADVRQTEELNKQAQELDRQQKKQQGQLAEQQRQVGEQQAKQQNAQALVDRLAQLGQQEENLLLEIGRVESAQTAASRNWIDGRNQAYPDPKEAGLPLLRGRLDNVRDEKRRVQRQLEQAQRQR